MIRKVSRLAGVLALVSVLPVWAAVEGRLGRDLVPTFEAIQLSLDPGKADYTGSARVELQVRQPARSFQFHAENLRLNRIALQGSAGTIALTHVFGVRGLVTVNLGAPLTPGAYRLEIDFSGQFETRPLGLFKVETGGQAYAFTQFEPDDARKAFPCWDEPSFKIPYQVTLVVPESHLAVSNTPIEKESVAKGKKTVIFRKTRPLPSYLLALATGPLETVAVPGLSVPGRVVTVKGQGHLAGEAVKFTPPILRALEGYFGRPYPFEKLDLIAVPVAGWWGAMENPGAVTFVDSLLLLDSRAASTAQRRLLAAFLAHELSHMWVGDLVTMEWWDDLWLNESFASWMGDKIAGRLYPALQITLSEIQEANFAMVSDARLATRAIRHEVRPSDNLMQSFDELAYPKGQRILGMFEQWMGEEKFRRGVQDYLNAHAWGNARASDLFGSLSKFAGTNVGAAMATFLDQGGVPLVSADLLPDGRVLLRQQRFLNYGVQAPAEALWQIPVTLKFFDGKTTSLQSLLLTRPAQSVAPKDVQRLLWIHPNAAEQGYYRWKAPPNMLMAMVEGAPRTLDARERVGFVSNLSALLDAGDIQGQDYLRVLGSFAEDPHPEVIVALLAALGKTRDTFVTRDLETSFASYVRRTMGPAVKRFGLSRAQGEEEAVSLLRPRLMVRLADWGQDERVLAYAESLAKSYLSDPASVDSSLVKNALWLSALRGDEALFDTYRKRFEATQAPVERNYYLRALASFRDPALVEKVLQYALRGPVRPGEAFSIIVWMIWGTPQLEDRSFAWMKQNYAQLSEQLSDSQAYILTHLAGGCSAQRAEDARAFFSEPSHNAPGTEKELAKVTESVMDCVKLREREGPAVAQYLKSR